MPESANKSDGDKHKIDDSIVGTSKIDPSEYSAGSSNPDRIASLKYSIAGAIYMFRREQSIKALSGVTLLILMLVVWLGIDRNSAALVILSLGMVWMGEFINSAVEAVVDLATEDIHPLAKVAKDVAASAVFLGTLVMLIVVVMILGPPLLDKLGI